MPTNEDRRYANKGAIDCAYTLAVDFLSCVDSLADVADIWLFMEHDHVYARELGSRVFDDFEALKRLFCDLEKSFCAIEENLRFAYAALLPHYGKSKRLLRLHLEDVLERVQSWVSCFTHYLGPFDGEEWYQRCYFYDYPHLGDRPFAKGDQDEDPDLERFFFEQRETWPITPAEIAELWSKCDLEYSRLLRDLASLPVSEGIEIGEAGKQAVETVENGDGLSSATLDALIGAGFGSVLNEARKLPAVNRHSRTMMEMLAKDASKYDWTQDDWVVHLKASKKTINECPAWKHILQWREDKKQQRPRAE